MQIIALVPPGNLARDLALYRRALFSRLGEGSALALPEFAPLAIASPTLRLPSRVAASRFLSDCWEGVAGSFTSSGLSLAGHGLYLSLSGPLELLASRAAAAPGASAAREALPAGAAADTPGPPLAAGAGLFLCLPEDPKLALREAQAIGPPRIDFLDCALVLYGVSYAGGRFPLAAAVWRELARARRRVGRPRSG